MSLNQRSAHPITLLRALDACPAAPFHEAYVVSRLRELCRDLDLPGVIDRYGNAVARYVPARADAAATPLALFAHTDHPGIEIVESRGRRAQGVLWGGVGAHCFARSVPLLLYDAGREVAGRTAGCTETGDAIVLDIEAVEPVSPGAFGVFDVGPMRESDGLLWLRAADDLAGCAVILSTLAACRDAAVPCPVMGVFTRAEEVGLVGATLVARQDLLPPDGLAVSLEASRALPGAEAGGGPVIRVGDRTSSFDPSGDALLGRAASRLRQADPAARIQRQLMSGGTCEATALQLAGYRATGLAFPLGNFHNVTVDGTIGPESIHQYDVETAVSLLLALAWEAAAAGALDPVRERLDRRADEYAARLEASAATWAR